MPPAPTGGMTRRWRWRLLRRSGVRMRDEEEIKGKLVATVYLKEILQ